MMPKPVWFDYLVWDYSDPQEPVAVGFKKDTPKDIIKAYKEQSKKLQEMQEEEPDALFI